MPGPYGYNGEGVARFSDLTIEPLSQGTPLLSASLANTPVLATGGTTARTLADFAAQEMAVQQFGAKGDGTTDDTAAIQAGINWSSAHGGVLLFPPGQYIVAGNLTINPMTRMRGTAVVGSTDGGYAQYGAQIWGTGTGSAMIGSAASTSNFGVEISQIALTAASTSTYTWVLAVSGMNNSRLLNARIQNNNTGTSYGGAYFHNEDPTTSGTGYAPVWSNFISCVTFGAVGGAPLNEQLTDSFYSQVYMSGGSGSIHGGLNNTWTNFMIDNWTSNQGLTISPSATGPGINTRYVGGNMQNTKGQATCIGIAPGGNATPFNAGLKFIGLSINNGTSSQQDIYLGNVENVDFIGLDCVGGSAKNIVCTGTVDSIRVIGGTQTGTVTLAGPNSGTLTPANVTAAVATISGTLATAVTKTGYQEALLGSGANTVTINGANTYVILGGSGSTSCTFSLGFTPADGQDLVIYSYAAVSSLTWPSGFNAPPASFTAGQSVRFKYTAFTGNWITIA